MLVADGRLVVVTTEGAISCYGADKVENPVEFALPAPTSLANDDPSVQAARAMIETLSSPTGGIAVVLGLDDGNLMRGLAHHPRWQVIGIDGDARRVEKIRHSLDAAGVPRSRVAVHHADPLTIGLPPYLAHLVTTERLEPRQVSTETDRFVRTGLPVCCVPTEAVACPATPDDRTVRGWSVPSTRRSPPTC